MEITSKVSLSFLAVVLILTITAVAILHLTAKEDLEKSIYNNLASVLASRVVHIETYLNMLETSVGELSKSAILNNLLKISDKEGPQQNDLFEAVMKMLAGTKAANPAIAEFLLMDKKGVVVAASSEKSIGSDKSTGSIFLGARKRAFVKDVYYSEIYKEPLIAVSAPILDSVTGELSGVLAARVRLNDLNDIVANRTGMGKAGEIYIVNKYGYMITRPRFKEDVVLKQLVDTRYVRRSQLQKNSERILPQGKEAGVFTDYRGLSVMGAYEYMPRMQWRVLAEVDAKEASAPLTKIRLVLLIILFIAPIAVWLSGRSIAKVIAGLINRPRKVAGIPGGAGGAGGANLDHGAGTGTNDGIGQLSRAFDTMAQNLKMITVSIGMLSREITEHKKADEERRIEEDRMKMRIMSEKSKENVDLLDELIRKHKDEIKELRIKNMDLEKRAT
ncbi:MAG: cache domain-containing protein [Candidatus Omnitrophica bacterium]|nr:cache domain-containing protein [Candidatus Omnitrophota bacterium]